MKRYLFIFIYLLFFALLTVELKAAIVSDFLNNIMEELKVNTKDREKAMKILILSGICNQNLGIGGHCAVSSKKIEKLCEEAKKDMGVVNCGFEGFLEINISGK